MSYVSRCPVDGCDRDATWRGTKTTNHATSYVVSCECQPEPVGFEAVVMANRRRRTGEKAA